MEKIRGFEVAKGFEDKGINLPVRKTKFSAGYDIEVAEEVIIPSFKKGMNPTLVKTGLKAYMQDDEVLMLYNRSSNPKKKGLILANSVGVIDKDYYGNYRRQKKMEILKISSKSNPNSVAGAIAGLVKESSKAEMQAIGAGALNQAVKAVAIARGFVAPTGVDLVCIPAFAEVEVEGEDRTGIKLIVESRA